MAAAVVESATTSSGATDGNHNNNNDSNSSRTTTSNWTTSSFHHSILSFFSLVPDQSNSNDTSSNPSNTNRNIDNGTPSSSSYEHLPIPKTFLYNCTSVNEHYTHIQNVVTQVQDLNGLKGLHDAGFDYIRVVCNEKRKGCYGCNKNGSNDADADADENSPTNNKHVPQSPPPQNQKYSCLKCSTKLYHMESKTFINKTNRKTYIADGKMYEEIVRLCQEYAQQEMMKEGNLHWITVCDDKLKGNPIRMLVSYQGDGSSRGRGNSNDDENDLLSDDDNNDDDKPILLITTGKGKVRAGIFSRQHLLVSSIESSTALPMIRDARRRDMRIAILDPNARGDRNGMSTYEQSMNVLFCDESREQQGQNNTKVEAGNFLSSSTSAVAPSVSNELLVDFPKASRTTKQIAKNIMVKGQIFVLAHSASGNQFAKYLMNQGKHHILSRIQSVAFTDSTHNVQWLLKEKEHEIIAQFFQSPASLYIRSSNEYRDDDWEKHKQGDHCETDKYWTRRFGGIKTIWAGTTDHSLTNWTSHSHIWDHFDRCDKDGLNKQ